MTEFRDYLENTRTLLSFENKAVVSVDTGKKIGSVQDVLIDPGNMSIEGIVTSSGGFLRSNVTAIKAEEIVLWGDDVVLVKHADVLRSKDNLPGLETCLSAYDNIPGQDVISLEGDRLGKVEDLHITSDGRLAAFTISRAGKGLSDLMQQDRSRRDSYHLPIATLHSFGKDVLILDVARVKDLVPEADRPVIEPEETRAETWTEEPDMIPTTGSETDETPPEDHRTL